MDPVTPPVVVVYAGSAATYVCQGGDVQPTYPLVPPLSEDALRQLHTPTSSSVSTAGPSPRLLERGSPHTGSSLAHLREGFLSLLHDRTVLLVLPLSSTASYREAWVRLCFHADVAVRRLVVLSDTVADCFACGQRSCVVVHASLSSVSLSRVEAGCSTRYSNSHVGSLHAVCGDTPTSTVAEQLPVVAAAQAMKAARQHVRNVSDSDGERDDALLDATDDADADQTPLVDLSDVQYRDALVHAFGYGAYRAVVVRPQQRRLNAQARSTSKGKGKGKGRRTQRDGSSHALLQALRDAYPSRRMRAAPGQLAKLLARVVQGGAAFASTDDSEPCVLAGEALAVPVLRSLYDYVIVHCGEAVWAAVEKERHEKQRARQKRLHAQDSNSATPQPPLTKRHRVEESAEDEESTDEEESSSSSSSSEDSDSSSDDAADEDDLWLYRQPTPLTMAPWWLPLLGASVVSRLPDQDLNRAAITADEARESNGTIVHWKMLL